MNNISRRGFLGSVLAVAASVVVPKAAEAATWFKVASTSYFSIGKPRIVGLRIVSATKSVLDKNGYPMSIYRTSTGVYSYYPQCSRDFRPLVVKGKNLYCPICHSNFNPRTGGPISPAPATRALRKYTVRIHSGQVQVALTRSGN